MPRLQCGAPASGLAETEAKVTPGQRIAHPKGAKVNSSADGTTQKRSDPEQSPHLLSLRNHA